jgi:hypothetical protein
MAKIGKCLFLFFVVVLLASSLLMVKPAYAQTISKPSVPKFTIQTQSQNNTTTITLTIINQPFDAASQYPNGFFYNVAISVDGKNWSNLYQVEDATDWYPEQSNSSTTVLTYVAGETMYYPMNADQRVAGQRVGVIPESGEVAFQVQAMIGHRDRGAFENGFMPYVLVGEKSDWSNAQTITLGQSPTSPSPSPTVPEFSWLAILSILFASSFVLIILRKGLQRKI